MANCCCCYPHYHDVLHSMLFERRVSFTQDQTTFSSHSANLAKVGAEEQEGRKKENQKEKKKGRKRTRLNCCRCRNMIHHHRHSSCFAICCSQWLLLLLLLWFLLVLHAFCLSPAELSFCPSPLPLCNSNAAKKRKEKNNRWSE